MTTQSRIAATVFTLGLVASGAAYGAGADVGGYYIGGSTGQARPDFDISGSVANANTTINTSDTAWKAYTGFQFNRNFAIEFTYINLGSYNVSNGNTIEPAGWGISLVGTVPLGNNFSLLGRISEYRMRQKMNPSGVDDNTWSPSFGAGLKYDFSPNVFGRAEYERIQSMGSNQSTIDNNSNVYTLGLGYKF
jgi:opacity protein-like surface antigen